MKTKILLGLTGSVATILYKKLVEQLSVLYEVTVIVTDKCDYFFDLDMLRACVKKQGGNVYTDKDEWEFNSEVWDKKDSILHIELRNKFSALVIAPCSANTLAKISNGICDNLLTCVVRAWDRNRPIILAPSMNTEMYTHRLTSLQLDLFKSFSVNNFVLNTKCKQLACKTVGYGALTNISDIVTATQDSLRWKFPFKYECVGIPIDKHLGAFLAKRKHHTHTGIDLYVNDRSCVHAVEAGVVVNIENFTGKLDNSPWWNDTKCVLVEGATGVVCYGELSDALYVRIGDFVNKGSIVGYVKQVLKDKNPRIDVQGHNTSMLHMELYPHGNTVAFRETGDIIDSWDKLLDPTPFLLASDGCPYKRFI